MKTILFSQKSHLKASIGLFFISAALVCFSALSANAQGYEIKDTSFYDTFTDTDVNGTGFEWTSDGWANMTITSSTDALSVAGFGRRYAGFSLVLTETVDLTWNPVLYFEAKSTVDTTKLEVRVLDNAGKSTDSQYTYTIAKTDDYQVFEIDLEGAGNIDLSQVDEINFNRAGYADMDPKADIEIRVISFGTLPPSSEPADSFNLTLSASPSEGGTVTGAGKYEAGTQVTIEAVPNTGYEFTGWTGDVTGTDSSTVVTVDSDMSLTAVFDPVVSIEKNTNNITASVYPNPLHNESLKINLEGFNKETQVNINDITGKLIYSKTVSTSTLEIANNGLLNKGIYIISISDNQNSTYKRLIVR